MISIETVDDKANKDIEYVTQDTLNLPSQQYWKATETIDAKLWIRNVEITLQDYTWDYTDWDVTISSDTALTRDMFYNKLTIQSWYRLTTTGYRVFANIIRIDAWGYISANGNNGSVGSNWTDWILQENPYPRWLWGAWGAWGTASPSWTIYWTLAWVLWWQGSNGSTYASTPVFTWLGWTYVWVWWLASTNWTSQTNSLCSLWGNSWGDGWYTGAWPWQSGWTGWGVTEYKWWINNPLLASNMIGFDWTNISLLRWWCVWWSWWAWLWGTWWAISATLAWWWGGGGGWSWASWGICYIRCKTLVNNGTIEANWWNGWNGGNGWNQWTAQEWSAWWGWAWWNWWVVLIATGNYQWDWIIQAIWWTWWTKWDNSIGSAASNGSDWAIWEVIRITL